MRETFNISAGFDRAKARIGGPLRNDVGQLAFYDDDGHASRAEITHDGRAILENAARDISHALIKPPRRIGDRAVEVRLLLKCESRKQRRESAGEYVVEL